MNLKGSLTPTLKSTTLKLLRKGDKDATLPENYRPISLLSVFYKIASCAISNRVKKALPFIIGKQQKAYVSNDNIGTVLINILGLIEHCNANKVASLLLLVDFQKAFNSISHKYIQTVLELFNFGPQICNWINLFFSNREAVILMGGHLTKKILLQQGVPQGDIISPFIFIIAVEILLIKITHSQNI